MASSKSHRLLETQVGDSGPQTVRQVAATAAGEHDAFIASPARLLQAQVETALLDAPRRKFPLSFRLILIAAAALAPWAVIALVIRALLA